MSQVSSLVVSKAAALRRVVGNSASIMVRQRQNKDMVLRGLSCTGQSLEAFYRRGLVDSSISSSLCPSNHHPKYFSSTTEKAGGVRGWMESRKENQEHATYMEQMERLSNMDRLTLENYKAELERGMSSWAAKLSFMQTKEMKVAQEVIDVVGSFMDVLGSQATADDLIAMDRLQRLKVATSSNKTLEEIGIMVSQMQNMDLMQRTLAQRKVDGKPIPANKDLMQQIIQKDAMSNLSKAQKDMMKERQKGLARKMSRKRRR